jgi:hypothetical protein
MHGLADVTNAMFCMDVELIRTEEHGVRVSENRVLMRTSGRSNRVDKMA